MNLEFQENNLKIVALILARSGSKGIPHKNIKLYKGIPLMAHSIKLGLICPYISDVYVSTDSKEYMDIALSYGANYMELRDPEISDDLSPDIDAFKHFLKWYFKTNNQYPDLIVQLRPTYPNRTINLLNNCIEKYISEYKNYDSLRTIIKIEKTPYKMYYIENNILKPYLKYDTQNRFKEPFNQARQYFNDSYLHNGCIDIIKTSIILDNDLLSGDRIMPYIMDSDETDDIDTLNDFFKSENKSLINI
jgi:N-acylneuraminate cytidylyltransferase